MCTASWSIRPDGFELSFNRDERRTRRPALPPARHVTDGGVAYLAPLDGDALGTWIAVTEHGLAFGLLNGFPAGTPPARDDWTSRGHVIPQVADATSADEALERAGRLPLDRFRPMQLLAVDAAGGAALADWSGRELTLSRAGRAPVPPLISSSFCTDEVRASRLDVWRRLVDDATDATDREDGRRRFHASHDPRRGPHSVCMHRPDARTVSFTRIVVDRRSATLSYTDDAPCRGEPGSPLRLARRAASEA